jgi:hypothetical protein
MLQYVAVQMECDIISSTLPWIDFGLFVLVVCGGDRLTDEQLTAIFVLVVCGGDTLTDEQQQTDR